MPSDRHSGLGSVKPGAYKKLSTLAPAEQMRSVRGYAILSKGDTPHRLDANAYTLPSQSGRGTYVLTRQAGSWTCACPDFQERRLPCKHLHALSFFLDFERRLKESALEEDPVEQIPACIYCGASDVIRYGKRAKHGRIKQRFQCRACRHFFIADKDFERMKGDAHTTTLILDLYFKGLSLRGIQDHLRQFHNLALDHSNILRRIRKFSAIINAYVQTLTPHVGATWHIDEMKIQAGGQWRWLWNLMDADTKFLISRKVTDRRRISDCRQLLRASKATTEAQPAFLISDGCHSYARSITKELPQTQHVRLASIRDKPNNNTVERLNGTVRDRLRPMRGLQDRDTAEMLTQAFQHYYNFIKPHSALDGRTPAEAAGLGTLGQEKWHTLMAQALKRRTAPETF